MSLFAQEGRVGKCHFSQARYREVGICHPSSHTGRSEYVTYAKDRFGSEFVTCDGRSETIIMTFRDLPDPDGLASALGRIMSLFVPQRHSDRRPLPVRERPLPFAREHGREESVQEILYQGEVGNHALKMRPVDS